VDEVLDEELELLDPFRADKTSLEIVLDVAI